MKQTQVVEEYCNSWRWSKHEENLVSKYIVGNSIHICSGRSKIGDIRLDLTESADIRGSCMAIPLRDKSFDTVISDPPWNLSFIPRFWQELERIARKRIIVICLSQFQYFGWEILKEEIIRRNTGLQLKVMSVYHNPNQTLDQTTKDRESLS